ncbi:isochorismate synthase [Marinoscillum sp.]|uniref:isochorismate synthase n=1 Tax=Marinoscillum sp. TaxID=2024838 RepID=UPI003BABA530
MSTQITASTIEQISTRNQALELIRKTLSTTYPVALWRLPNTTDILALIDITSEEGDSDAEIERLEQCFVINSYDQSHPIHPLVLKGDIMISIHGSESEVTLNTTLKASDLESFNLAIDQASLSAVGRSARASERHPDFEEMVTEAINHIKSGELHKVVLSRYQDFDLPESFDPIVYFEKLEKAYPNAFCYLVQTATYGAWMGATPEKLIAIEDEHYFSTDALAGTQVLGEVEDLSDVPWTQKEIIEQAMVSRYIIECFKKIRLREFEEVGPKTVKAGDLVHLKTSFKVDMKETNSPLLGSIMLELLHPTSAVCGSPRGLANDFIHSHEGYERELFAGFLGPVGLGGNSRLFVNLRCMQLFREKARLYAGAGITENSRPEKELQETNNKMQTLLKVIYS